MTKKAYLLIAILFVAAAVGGAFYLSYKPIRQVACTMEAKLCPDGSAVGRVGPNCEFAQCPDEQKRGGTESNGTNVQDITATGLIRGKVDVGPICPVERPGVPCPVPAEAYTSREVILYASDGIAVVKRMHFGPDGTYQFEVPAGVYILDIPRQQADEQGQGGTEASRPNVGLGGSKDLPKTLTIKSGETLEINFSIDTGIR